jgi:cytochrome c556
MEIWRVMESTMIRRMASAVVVAVLCTGAVAQQKASRPASSAADTRQLVRFPDAMRLHTIANMRDHLHTLEQINAALATNAFESAASIAEQRLGLSSLDAHGAAHLAPYMPKPMQDIGTAMHRAASRFAVEAQNAGASNDVRPALAALSAVMNQCVACHAAYRLQ